MIVRLRRIIALIVALASSLGVSVANPGGRPVHAAARPLPPLSAYLVPGGYGDGTAASGNTLARYDLTSGRRLGVTRLAEMPGNAVGSAPLVVTATGTGHVAVDPTMGDVYLLGYDARKRLLVQVVAPSGVVRATRYVAEGMVDAAMAVDPAADRLVIAGVSRGFSSRRVDTYSLHDGTPIAADATDCPALYDHWAPPLAFDPTRHILYCVDPGAATHDDMALVGAPTTVHAWDALSGHELSPITLPPYPAPMLQVIPGGLALLRVQATTAILEPSRRTPASPLSRPAPRAGVRYFPQSRHTLQGAFLAFWTRYGGVSAFGYPQSEPFVEDGHLVQYTDRFTLQAEAGGHVSTAPIEQILVDRREYGRAADQRRTGERYFASTHHTLWGRFLAFWQGYHGAALLGAPISEPFVESNSDGSGRRYLLQWFERGRLEYHPELRGPFAMELGLVGLQALRERGWVS